ncbi:MAG: NAD(P)/FAD-dependent oxidoreductase [Candidatus Nanoarchaeia archaeon]|nr:NAD(P)/FAD-dependent oxidoreductase [Candidatus Nanoarchaeia archaeon]
MKSFDCAIIGAGPTGSYLAEQLSIKGLKVGLFEKKKAVGKPIQCTGLLTKEIEKYADINSGFVDNITEKIRLCSKNNELVIKSKEYVVDREKFDNYFLDRAKNAGAKVFLGQEFVNCKENKIIFSNNSINSARIIGCDGPLSRVNKVFGIIKKMKYLLGKQFVIKTKAKSDEYKAYFDEEFRDFFAWQVPVSKDLSRVGIASENHSSVNEKLNFFIKSRKIKGKIRGINAGLIPLFNPFASNYFKSRKISAYLFGDAAGFVKASTGGGIIPSFKAIDESLKSIINGKKPFLFNSKKELCAHLLAHNAMKKFNDNDYDSIIGSLKTKKSVKILQEISRDDFIRMGAKLLINNPWILRHFRIH